MNVFARSLIFSLAPLVAVGSLLGQNAPSKQVPMCTASQLSLGTDAENGSFNGMSHGGTLLVLRNLGPNACRIEAFPEITFGDAKGPVKIAFTVPGGKFIHPGPVMIPATLAPGAEVTSSVRWVSSPVFDPGVCFDIKSVSVKIGDGNQSSALAASICGANATSVSVERTRMAVDPVYKP